MQDIFFSGINHDNDPIKTKALVEHFFNRPPEEPRAWVFQTQSNGVVVRTNLTPARGTFVGEDTIYPQLSDKVSLRIRCEAKKYFRNNIEATQWMTERSLLLGVEISRIQVESRMYDLEKGGNWKSRIFDFHIVGTVINADALKQVMDRGFTTKMRCWGFGFVQANIL